MPWLAVLGSGSWTPARGIRFEAGVHEISEEVAEMARRSPVQTLVVLQDRPEVYQREPGPLKPEDLKRGLRGLQLADAVALQDADEEEAVEIVRNKYGCHYCTDTFPSEAAANRHVDRAHSVHPSEQEEEPVPEPKPTPSAVAAAFGPFGIDGTVRPEEQPPPEG